MMTGGMYSSNTDMWATPQDFFDKLNAEFHFDTDVCAVKENAKCEHFFSPQDDGLKQKWGGKLLVQSALWKGDRQMGKKAAESHATVVMLLPARTDTKWFHDYIYGKAEIRFLRGRLHFNNAKGAAPFPSMIVIFRGDA